MRLVEYQLTWESPEGTRQTRLTLMTSKRISQQQMMHADHPVVPLATSKFLRISRAMNRLAFFVPKPGPQDLGQGCVGRSSVRPALFKAGQDSDRLSYGARRFRKPPISGVSSDLTARKPGGSIGGRSRTSLGAEC